MTLLAATVVEDGSIFMVSDGSEARNDVLETNRPERSGPMQDRIALGLLAEVEIKLVQISSAWLLRAQQ